MEHLLGTFQLWNIEWSKYVLSDLIILKFKNLKMESDRRTDIYPPSLPSNLKRDHIDDIQFNSIGFYSDLINRLND